MNVSTTAGIPEFLTRIHHDPDAVERSRQYDRLAEDRNRFPGPTEMRCGQCGYVAGRGHAPNCPRAADAQAPEPRNVSLPDDAAKRNEYPMADGLLDYFPNALAEVSRLSFLATQQHHPDKPMHWDRTKSKDHRNKIMRHLIDAGKLDDKGLRHSAMVAWRALALLQEELEADEGLPMSRASRS